MSKKIKKYSLIRVKNDSENKCRIKGIGLMVTLRKTGQAGRSSGGDPYI